jgi:hypothetical protein
MAAVLVLALLAPLAGAVVSTAWRPGGGGDAEGPIGGRAAVARGAAGAAAALWLAVLLADGASAGRFAADTRTAAAAGGAALLVAVAGSAGARPLVALAAATAGLAGGLGGGHAGDLLVGLAVAVVAGSAAGLRPALPWRLAMATPWAVAGLAAVTAGVARLHDATGNLDLPAGAPVMPRVAGTLLAIGAGALALSGTRRPLGAHAVLLPAGMAIGLHVAPAVEGAASATVAFAAAGAVAAWGVPRGLRDRRPSDPAGALALWCLAAAHAAAAGAAQAGVAPLVGAASVLSAAVGLVPAVAAAAPAAAALAFGLRENGSGWTAVAGVLAVVTAAGMARPATGRRRRRSAPLRAGGRADPDPVPAVLRWLPAPRLGTGAAALLAVWLLAAPGTWGWAGPVSFGAWSRTALVGVPAATLALAAAARAGVTVPPDLGAPPPLPADIAPRRPRPAGWVARARAAGGTAAVGLAGAWLVLSLARGR